MPTMTPVILQGDACHMPLQDKSIHSIITSPPYFGLRQYEEVEPGCWPGGQYSPSPGAPPIIVPGPTPYLMAACEHIWEHYSIPPGHTDNGITRSTLQGGKATQAQTQRTPTTGAYCKHCRCWRGTLGNEKTVQEYVWHSLLWLREVHRILREDGTFWLIIGDSYGKDGSLLGIPWLVAHAAVADGWVLRDECPWFKDGPMPESVRGSRYEQARCPCLKSNRLYNGTQSQVNGRREHPHGGVAVIPATKPNPDCPQCHGTGRLEEWVLRKGAWRHTRATESVFMLAKSMNYWSDGEAVRETNHGPERRRGARVYHEANADPKGGGYRGMGGMSTDWQDSEHPGRNPRNTLREPPSPAADLRALVQWLQAEAPEVLDAYREAQTNPVNVVRPKSSQLDLPHYASFPPSLIEQFIKASVPAKCCPTCGNGWAPVVERGESSWEARKAAGHDPRGYHVGDKTSHHAGNPCVAHLAPAGASTGGLGWVAPSTVHGYAPTCPHYCTCDPTPHWDTLEYDTGRLRCPTCAKLGLQDHVPGVVADCFGGSGTVALVARALDRRSIVMDASAYYTRELMRERLGLADLARWEGTARAIAQYGAEAIVEPLETYNDLPLFRDQ
jgi:DNA modification methylase